jgi:tetratricopeptide (TPR) repeat protein
MGDAMTFSTSLRRWASLFGGLALMGCGTLGGSPSSQDEARQGVVVRPDAAPEYDLLVAQDLEQRGRMAEALAAYQRAVAKDPESAYLHRRVAESLVRQNRLGDAITHAERAHELDPDDESIRLFLGQLYRLARSPASAERVLLSESGEPLGETAAVLLYEVYLDSKRVDDAQRVAEWLVEHDPASVRNRLALAAVYGLAGRTDDAERILREALADDPDNLRIYVELARLRRESGDHAGEMDIYREILARSPHHHAALVSLSDAQLKAEDLVGAEATLREIEQYHPEDLRSVVRLAFINYENRDYAEAAERFQRAVELTPEQHEIRFFLGIAQRRSGQPDRAVETFERIPPESDHYAEARTQLAALHERQARYSEALAQVEKARAVKPSRELDLYAATLQAKSGDFEGAVAHLEALLEEQPNDDQLLYNLGVVYGEADKIEESIEFMRRALAENPDNASALNYIGYTWAERGINLDEAEAMIARALELRPEDGYIADSLGWVYYMRARPLVDEGQHGEARKYIDRALQELERADDLTGGDPVVSEHLGDTYLLLNEKENALEHFEEALRLEPRFGEQPDLLEKLESLRRELQ